MRACLFVFSLTLLILAPLAAQEGAVVDERGATEFNDSDIEQNVVRQSILKRGSGERQLQVAQDLKGKVATETDAKKRAKLEKKIRRAQEAAVRDFRDALGYNSKMVEAWAGLGAAYREQEKYQEALQAFSEGSKLDPSDEACFSGWAGALLDGKMFGNLVAAHGQLSEADPDRASKLLGVARTWLEERRADPGDVESTDLDRLADWMAGQ